MVNPSPFSPRAQSSSHTPLSFARVDACSPFGTIRWAVAEFPDSCGTRDLTSSHCPPHRRFPLRGVPMRVQTGASQTPNSSCPPGGCDCHLSKWRCIRSSRRHPTRRFVGMCPLHRWFLRHIRSETNRFPPREEFLPRRRYFDHRWDSRPFQCHNPPERSGDRFLPVVS